MGNKANCYGERRKLQHANPCLKNGTVTRPIAHLPLSLHNNEKKVHSKHQLTPLKSEYRKHIKPNIIRSIEWLDMREALNWGIGD